MLEYRIEEKDAFTVMGKLARFDCETSYQEIPRFWARAAAGRSSAAPLAFAWMGTAAALII